MKKLSILIPVYNSGNYLCRLMDSIMSQIDERCEIILLNDGSTDNSLLICEEYTKTNAEFVRLISRNNKGAVRTRRELLEASQGEWIWIIDSDDDIVDEAISTLLELLPTSDCDMVLFDYYYVGKNTTSKKEQLTFGDGAVFEENNKYELYRRVIEGGSIHPLWNKVFRRNIVDFETDYEPFYDVRKANDCLQMLPIITKARKILYFKRPLYIYYAENPNSLSHYFKEYTYTSLQIVWRLKKHYLSLWNLWETYAQLFYNSCAYVACMLITRYVLDEHIKDKNIERFFCRIIEDDIFGESIRNSRIRPHQDGFLLIWLMKKKKLNKMIKMVLLLDRVRKVRCLMSERVEKLKSKLWK